VLIKQGDQGADDACIFDNVSFQFTPLAAIDVPTLDATGFAVLAALLALAGLGVLRRQELRRKGCRSAGRPGAGAAIIRAP
jgi:hypothetical protein